MPLTRISETAPVIIKQYIEGKPGKDGKDGITTTIYEQTPGKPGKDGKDAKGTETEVKNDEIRYKKPDGTWSHWMKLGGGGGNALTPQQEAVLAQLIAAENGIQVSATGAVYFGDSTVNGTWRVIRSGANLNFERLENDIWIAKGGATA